MDYSIGSLSDLITGSNTLNKPKVIKKEIKESVHKSEPPIPNEVIEKKITITPNKDSLNGKKIKKPKSELSSNTLIEKKTKKRKLDSTKEEPVKKKSKNCENAERRIHLKNKIEKEEDPERYSCTVFVGNLPLTSDIKKIKKFFMKYGKVESVRIRGIPVANPKTPKRVALIKKEFHPERKSFYGFVKFETHEDAIKALEANGVLYREHHLRVSLCDSQNKPDETKAIFVGNLSFYAEEDDLWKLFEPCGPIASVRIIRDGKTGMGKGFGYVNFTNADSVPLALEMEEVKLKDRELRISICNTNSAKKNKKTNKVKKIRKPRKVKDSETGDVKNENGEENSPKSKVNKSFQGAKFADKKKKKKLDKGLLQKKKLIKKIAPK